MKVCNYRNVFKRTVLQRKDFKVEEKLDNGIVKKQISFTYPVENGKICCEDIIEYDEECYRVKEAPVNEQFGTIVAMQDTDSLSGHPIQNLRGTGMTILQYADIALQNTGWVYKNISANTVDVRNITEANTDSMKMLEKIAEVFWVEIEFRAKEKRVLFYNRVGRRTKIPRFIKGFNLKSLDIKTDTYDFYTRIIPYGKNGLTIESVNNGKNYLDNMEYMSAVRTAIWEDTNYTDAAQLKSMAEKKLGELATPKVTYTAQILDVASISEEYADFSFGLGDEADIIEPDMEIMACERIVRITRYPDNPEKNTVELSNRNVSFADMQKKLLAASDSISNVTNGKVIISSKVDGLQGTVQVAAQAAASEAVQTAVNSAAPNFLTSGRAPSADKWQTTRYLEGVGVDGTANRHHYTTCSTSGGTAAKTASLTGFSLQTGARVAVLFSNANTASNPTLNISSTGAKPIYYRNSAIPANYIQAGTVLELVYSGSYWRVIGDLAQYQLETIGEGYTCGDVTSQITWSGCTGCSAYRIGKMVFFKAEVTTKSAAAITFAVIPDALRPASLTALQADFPKGEDILKKGLCWAYTDGNVKLTTFLNHTAATTAATAGNTLVTGAWMIK